MNITNNLTPVINMIFNLMTWCIGKMKDIEFFGTNLLVFSITIVILSIAIPILLVVPSKAMTSISERVHKVRDYDIPKNAKKEENYRGYQKDKRR